MADDTIYRLETIDSQPFPIPGSAVIPQESQTVRSVQEVNQVPTTIPAQFPQRLIAHQTISESFDTLSKRILGNFNFGVLGAISIGNYINGESGDIKISPTGILARNVNGETTLALDAATGNVTIKGTLEAGSLIAGSTQVGDDSIEIDGVNKRIVFYDDGVPVIIIGEL